MPTKNMILQTRSNNVVTIHQLTWQIQLHFW